MPEVINNSYYVSAVYVVFVFIWLIIIIFNRFVKSSAAFVLVIPFIIFAIGFMNSDCIDNALEEDVFRVSFISVGLLLSLPLLKLFNEKGDNRQLNHVIFLAMIFTLISYYHIWVPLHDRHICKVIQSSLETISITLYIFALTIFFLI